MHNKSIYFAIDLISSEISITRINNTILMIQTLECRGTSPVSWQSAHCDSTGPRGGRALQGLLRFLLGKLHHSLLWCVMLCYVVSYYALICSAIWFNTLQCYVMKCFVITNHIMRWVLVLCYISNDVSNVTRYSINVEL